MLAHKVSLIALHAGALQVQTAPTPERVAATTELIGATARDAVDDLREVLGVLSSTGVDECTLMPVSSREDIVRVVEESRAAGVEVVLHLDQNEPHAPIARAAHRVVREGLTNVHKHANGAHILVTVTGDARNGTTIEVVNDPPVANPLGLSGAGVGLTGLAERVGLLGGRMEATALADGGWRLTARMPWTVP